MESAKSSSYLFELSGEHPTLPLAELVSTIRAEVGSSQIIISGPGYAVVSIPSNSFDRIAGRLALTHRAGEFLAEVDLKGKDLHLDIPEGTLALRVRRFDDRAGDWDVDAITKKIAAMITVGRKVDLMHPDIEIRGIASDRLLLYRKLMEVNRRQFDLRRVAERPFFSPISLHPRYARALINLTGLKKGEAVLDPFCGTGGILIEAAIMGLRTYGSDISEEMIEGARRNIEHFGLRADRLEVIDVGSVHDVFGEVDGIVTDPPYGRATSTNKEGLVSLYSRALVSMKNATRPGGGLGVVFPFEMQVPSGLELIEIHHQRVHRSLTRHYHIMRRR
ncbi:MAG: methyltransferase domain-containing protein [Methanomassiliicoccales archaeon]|nr:MAG: methyltransferase domain-containing protein [Methanomassiliicoccales archaeon]